MFKSNNSKSIITGKKITNNGRGKVNTTSTSFSTKVATSSKAGLVFPVGRVARYLKRGKYSERISLKASIYLTAVLEYMTSEILDLSVKAAIDNKKSRIIPRHIFLAVSNDTELSKFFGDNTVTQGGVRLNIHPALLPVQVEKKDKKDK